jgi:hypothetical protein
MLTQLTTVKTRLGILDTDTTNDTLLTNAIKAISARFDRECNRTLARTENFLQEFPAEETSICAACYPIETVTKFETKISEAEGWVERTGIDYLVRQRCVICLPFPLSTLNSQPSTCRMTYTGGYVLPADPDPQPSSNNPQPVRLPADLEQAAVEQVAFWFQNRDRLGLLRIWDYHATYRHFAALDLLDGVKAVLRKHARWIL